MSFAFLFGVVCASGRDYAPFKAGGSFNARDVGSVRVDDAGFVWASTKLGVIRVASGSSKTYALPADNTSIRDVRLEYASGVLYAYLDNGKVFRYDAAADRFVNHVDISGLVSSGRLSVYQMICDVEGNLWFACSLGVLKCSPDNAVSSVAFSENVGAQPSMCPDGDDILYVCSARGVVRINRITETFSLVVGADRRLRSTSSLYDRSARRLWIGTMTDGIFYLDDGSDVLHEVSGMPDNIPVRALKAYKDGMIIAGTDGAGIYFIDAASATVTGNDRNDVDAHESIGSNNILDICPDGGRVLVATSGAGLFFFRDNDVPITLASHRTNDRNSLSNNHVNGVFESVKGRTYVATDSGVDIYDIASRKWSHICEGVICSSVSVDSHGILWVGTYGNGFHIFDVSTLASRGHFQESPSGSGRRCPVVRHFLEDGDGDVWILGYRNVILYDRSEDRYVDYPPHSARSGCVAPDGRICLACEQGLLMLDKATGESEVLCEGVMLDVCSDGNGIWAASSGLGLVHYDLGSKSVSRVTRENGLNSDFVNSVQYDSGKIWAGTENGLNSYDPASGEVDAYLDFPLLSRSNFNPGAGFVQVNGAHLYGTGTGLLKFHPDRLDRFSVQAAIYVEDIRFSGISVRDMNSFPAGTVTNDIREVRVKHSQNNFAIDLTAVGDYDGEFRFIWLLDEMDKKWSPPQETRLCRYTNLKVGKNHFHLRLVDSLGKTVYDSRDFVFIVQPPVWRSWWFILLASILAVYILAGVWMHHSDRIKSRVVPIINISRAAAAPQESEPTDHYDDPFVRKAIEVVNANLQNPDFDKDSFASEMNVSASSLYKKLKSLSDQSPTEFIKTIRMTKALDLLQSHKYTVTEVSEMCGYSSASYFSTAFKNFYGRTPNEI